MCINIYMYMPERSLSHNATDSEMSHRNRLKQVTCDQPAAAWLSFILSRARARSLSFVLSVFQQQSDGLRQKCGQPVGI